MKNTTLFKRKVITKHLAIVFMAATLMQSCIKDNFDFDKIAEIKYDPNFAIPLVYSSMDINNILSHISDANGFISIDNNNFITLLYESNFVSSEASQLTELTLPTVSDPASIPVPPGAGTVNSTQNISFSISPSTKIDSIGFKKGSFDFSFSGISNAQIGISIPAAKQNGVPFFKTVTLPASSDPVSYDLSGYVFDMTLVGGGPAYNQFDVDFSVTTTAGNPGGTLQITSAMNDLQFFKLFGDLGSLQIADYKDTIDLSLFKNSLGAASFSLINPKVSIIVDNSFGVPLDINLPQLEGKNQGGSAISILNSAPWSLNVTSPNLSQAGQVITSTSILDTTNSQIATLLSNTPQSINYELMASTNTISASQSEFVFDTSHFSSKVRIELPLYGTATNFSLVDTLPFSLGENFSDNIAWGLIRLANSNGFPIDLGLQVYFADSTYTLLDSLFSSTKLLLHSGTVDFTTGKVTSPTTNTTDVIMDKTKLAKLNSGKYIIIKASISTTNAGNTDIKIYSNYKLKVSIGAQLQMDVQKKRRIKLKING